MPNLGTFPVTVLRTLKLLYTIPGNTDCPRGGGPPRKQLKAGEAQGTICMSTLPTPAQTGRAVSCASSPPTARLSQLRTMRVAEFVATGYTHTTAAGNSPLNEMDDRIRSEEWVRIRGSFLSEWWGPIRNGWWIEATPIAGAQWEYHQSEARRGACCDCQSTRATRDSAVRA